MTRKKKGPAPKRKPVVRRRGYGETLAQANARLSRELGPDDPCGPIATLTMRSTSSTNQPFTVRIETVSNRPSRWSRVVAWVRENPLDAAIAFLGFAVAGGIIAVLL